MEGASFLIPEIEDTFKWKSIEENDPMIWICIQTKDILMLLRIRLD